MNEAAKVVSSTGSEAASTIENIADKTSNSSSNVVDDASGAINAKNIAPFDIPSDKDIPSISKQVLKNTKGDDGISSKIKDIATSPLNVEDKLINAVDKVSDKIASSDKGEYEKNVANYIESKTGTVAKKRANQERIKGQIEDVINDDSISNKENILNELETDLLKNQLSPNERNITGDIKPGDKVAPGKEINDEGKIDDSPTKKTLTAIGRGAAAYVSGGTTLTVDQSIKNNRTADHVIGVVADKVDKIPLVKTTSKALEATMIPDLANDAFDVIGDIATQNYAALAAKAKDIGEHATKAVSKIFKKVAMAAFGIFMFVSLISVSFMGPGAGAVQDLSNMGADDEIISEVIDSQMSNLTNDDGAFKDLTNDEIYDYIYSQINKENIKDMVPEYKDLSEDRKNIINMALLQVGLKYQINSRPTSSGIKGIPSEGLDSIGFVEWTLWSAFDENPGNLTYSTITNEIGSKFIEVNKEELKPGDIGLKHLSQNNHDNDEYNHAGIYIGNGLWIYAIGGRINKVIISDTTMFTTFLSYERVVN